LDVGLLFAVLPYVDEGDDMLGKVAQYVTLLTFFSALLVKLGQLRRSEVLGVLLVLLNSALFFLAAVLVTWQLRIVYLEVRDALKEHRQRMQAEENNHGTLDNLQLSNTTQQRRPSRRQSNSQRRSSIESGFHPADTGVGAFVNSSNALPTASSNGPTANSNGSTTSFNGPTAINNGLTANGLTAGFNGPTASSTAVTMRTTSGVFQGLLSAAASKRSARKAKLNASRQNKVLPWGSEEEGSESERRGIGKRTLNGTQGGGVVSESSGEDSSGEEGKGKNEGKRREDSQEEEEGEGEESGSEGDEMDEIWAAEEELFGTKGK
jgi:hypothetical protein